MTEPKKSIVRISDLPKGEDFYAKCKGEAVKIGCGILGGEVVTGSDIFLPLKTMNRHGLIAGATGTGKTKTLQLISEYLSEASVPVLLLDIKGDLSGLAAAGVLNDKIAERCKLLSVTYQPSAFPVEFFTLSNCATIRSFADMVIFRSRTINFPIKMMFSSQMFQHTLSHR